MRFLDWPGCSAILNTRSGPGPQQQSAFSRRSVIAAILNLRYEAEAESSHVALTVLLDVKGMIGTTEEGFEISLDRINPSEFR